MGRNRQVDGRAQLFFSGRDPLRPLWSNTEAHCAGHTRLAEYATLFRPKGCRSFFDWYNPQHHHAGIGLMTPDQVNYSQAVQVHATRQIILDGRPLNASSERSPNLAQSLSRLGSTGPPGNPSRLNTKRDCLTIIDAFRYA
jgi:hypothetical protein